MPRISFSFSIIIQQPLGNFCILFIVSLLSNFQISPSFLARYDWNFFDAWDAVVGDKPAAKGVRAESFVHSWHFLSVTLSKVGTDILKNWIQYFKNYLRQCIMIQIELEDRLVVNIGCWKMKSKSFFPLFFRNMKVILHFFPFFRKYELFLLLFTFIYVLKMCCL